MTSLQTVDNLDCSIYHADKEQFHKRQNDTTYRQIRTLTLGFGISHERHVTKDRFPLPEFTARVQGQS